MGCPGAHSRSVLGGLNAMNAASATNTTSMAPAELNAADLAAWIRCSNELVAEHADELTRLDSAIGRRRPRCQYEAGPGRPPSRSWTLSPTPRRSS